MLVMSPLFANMMAGPHSQIRKIFIYGNMLLRTLSSRQCLSYIQIYVLVPPVSLFTKLHKIAFRQLPHQSPKLGNVLTILG